LGRIVVDIYKLDCQMRLQLATFLLGFFISSTHVLSDNYFCIGKYNGDFAGGFSMSFETENVKIQNFKLNGRSIANGKVNDILKTGTLQINDETHHIGVSPNNTASNEPKRITIVSFQKSKTKLSISEIMISGDEQIFEEKAHLNCAILPAQEM
jgi:hypothetical protein